MQLERVAMHIAQLDSPLSYDLMAIYKFDYYYYKRQKLKVYNYV